MAHVAVDVDVVGALDLARGEGRLRRRLRQRRTGLGWRGLAEAPAPASAPSVGLTEVDEILEGLGGLSGSGS